MDSENTSVALGRVLGALAFCFKPIMLALWVFKALFRLVTWPIRTPWKLVMRCLEATITLLVEYGPFLIYLTGAVIIGMLSGAFAGVLTALFATWLPLVFPFLRRRSRRHLHRHHRGGGGGGEQQQPQPQKGATPAGPAVSAVAAKPKPKPRHVASALTWSSDEEEGLPGPLVPPPTLFHKGLTAKGKAAATAAAGGSSAAAGSSSSAAVAGPSTWSRGSRGHRAQQPGKPKVRVGDTIHEESSLSDDQWAAGGSKGKR